MHDMLHAYRIEECLLRKDWLASRGEFEGPSREASPAPRLEAVHPVLMVRDVARSVRFYAALGFALRGQDSASDPKYVWIARDGVELHLQWHDAAEWSDPNDRPTYRFPVQDVDGLHAQLRACGEALEMTSVTDTSWGTREFHVRDPDRNGLQFYRGR
jgi:catechol 2,3-dioxygenase-like lactoylglutathione lyase family enzyme